MHVHAMILGEFRVTTGDAIIDSTSVRKRLARHVNS